MEKKRPGIMLYFSFGAAMTGLSDEQCGKLFKAMIEYGQTGATPEFDGLLAGAWLFAKASIDTDGAKYNEICDKRKAAIEARWSKQNDSKDTNEYTCIQNVQMNDLNTSDTNDTNININSNINSNININPNINKESICKRKDVRQVIDAWNALGLSQVEKITADTQRGKQLSARVKEYGVDKVISTIQRIRSSEFLQGKNDRGWKATLDWVMLPNNFIKVAEGQYDDASPRPDPYTYEFDPTDIDKIKIRKE